MSETRAAYNVAMQPGRELDALVARVMGQSVTYTESYSEEDEPAMRAWAWLEENHTATAYGILCLYRQAGKTPAVGILVSNEIMEDIATGSTYPHAISLAILNFGKGLGVVK